MNKLTKGLHILQWIIIGLLHTFPLVLALPFLSYLEWSWWVYALPVGLIPLGFVTVPLALIGRNQDKWKLDGRYFSSIWWIWDNKEEGCPDWWLKMAASGEEGKIAKMFPRWWWFAIRNPANGIRYIFKDRPAKVEGWQEDSMEVEDLINAKVSRATRWKYAGPFAGWRKVVITDYNKYSEYWFGWKVDSKIPGMGFTMQIRRNRKFGT